MAYQSPWASLYGSATNPPTAPIQGIPFLPQPIPSAPHHISNVRNRTQSRRLNIAALGPRTSSEYSSVSRIPNGTPQYHEAALCSSNFENLAQRITGFLQQRNVEGAAALVHDCAKERWTFGKNKFGKLNQTHLDVVNLLHKVYSVLTVAGKSLNGGTCRYQQDFRGKRFIFENNNHGVEVTINGPRQLYGGKRKLKSKTRKQRKTRRQK